MEGGISSAAEKRIAVVTGANKGIGLEICRQLASHGTKVILTSRDEKRGMEAVQNLKGCGLSDVLLHQLDVTDPSSIASLANHIKTQFGKLDILVNNAAVAGLTIDPEILRSVTSGDNEKKEATGDVPDWLKDNIQETYELAEECMRTNYYGTKDVTETLLPLLQLSDSARIVNVSSIFGQLKVIPNERIKHELCHKDGITNERLDELAKSFLKDYKEGLLDANGWPTGVAAYKMSKALVNAYTRALAKRHMKMCINCVHPGYVKTDVNYNTGVLSVEEGAKGPVKLALLPGGSSLSGLFFDQTEVSTF